MLSWPKEVLALMNKAQVAINLIVFMVFEEGGV
jgi:hypothetical protein